MKLVSFWLASLTFNWVLHITHWNSFVVSLVLSILVEIWEEMCYLNWHKIYWYFIFAQLLFLVKIIWICDILKGLKILLCILFFPKWTLPLSSFYWYHQKSILLINNTYTQWNINLIFRKKLQASELISLNCCVALQVCSYRVAIIFFFWRLYSKYCWSEC